MRDCTRHDFDRAACDLCAQLRLPVRGIWILMSNQTRKPPTRLSAEARESIDQLGSREYAVLVGRNNCGKSYLLKTIGEKLGRKARYIGPMRYQQMQLLGNPNLSEKGNEWRQLQDWRQADANADQMNFSMQRAIADLSNVDRALLFDLVKSLLSVVLSLEHDVPTMLLRRYLLLRMATTWHTPALACV